MKFKTHLEAAEYAGKTHLKTLHPDLQPIIGDAVRRIFQTHATCSHRIKKQRQMKSTPDYLTTSVKNVNFVLQATAAVKESEDHVALEARLQSEMDVFRTKLMREYVLPHEDIKLAAAHKECVEAYVDLIILAAKCFIAQHDVPKYDELQATVDLLATESDQVLAVFQTVTVSDFLKQLKKSGKLTAVPMPSPSILVHSLSGTIAAINGPNPLEAAAAEATKEEEARRQREENEQILAAAAAESALAMQEAARLIEEAKKARQEAQRKEALRIRAEKAVTASGGASVSSALAQLPEAPPPTPALKALPVPFVSAANLAKKVAATPIENKTNEAIASINDHQNIQGADNNNNDVIDVDMEENAADSGPSREEIFGGRATIKHAILQLLKNVVREGLDAYDRHVAEKEIADRIKKAAAPARLNSAAERIMNVVEKERPVDRPTLGGLVDDRVMKRTAELERQVQSLKAKLENQSSSKGRGGNGKNGNSRKSRPGAAAAAAEGGKQRPAGKSKSKQSRGQSKTRRSSAPAGKPNGSQGARVQGKGGTAASTAKGPARGRSKSRPNGRGSKINRRA